MSCYIKLVVDYSMLLLINTAVHFAFHAAIRPCRCQPTFDVLVHDCVPLQVLLECESTQVQNPPDGEAEVKPCNRNNARRSHAKLEGLTF